MATTPPSNLSPASLPWARDRDAAIAQLQRDAAKAKEDNSNAFAALGGTLNQISRQIATISAQQTTLTTAVANINTLIGQQISTGSFDNTSTGWTPTVGWTTIASSTITVPTGFTKALTISFGYSYLYYTYSGAGIVATRVVVNGVVGDQDENNGTSGVYVVGNASTTSLITGLTAGGTFTVQTQLLAGAMASDPTNKGHVYGVVLWLR